MTQKYIAGIDPGLYGAICLYHPEQHLIVEMFDMPLLEITRNGKKKNQIDLYSLARFIDVHAKNIGKAYIENPQGMPGMADMYRLGMNVGIAQMAIASAFIPMDLVAPATWKKQMGLSKDKDASRLKASQMAPNFSHHWSRVKDDGRAEAFLLTQWGMNKEMQNGRS